MQCTAPSPPSCLSFTLLDNVQPDFLWRLVNRNGSSTKLCTVGISTFLLSHKITACCSILCYGRCVPMGWLVEQRMGESRPACSSKQVLGAFEDAHLLQAKKGFGRRDVLAVRIRAHTDTLTLRFQHSQQSDHQDLLTSLIQRPAAWWHAQAKREVLEREQIVCTLKVKVMRSLFSKDIWSIIHCLCLQLVQRE